MTPVQRWIAASRLGHTLIVLWFIVQESLYESERLRTLKTALTASIGWFVFINAGFLVERLIRKRLLK